jgi:hypothetical protein
MQRIRLAPAAGVEQDAGSAGRASRLEGSEAVPVRSFARELV